MPQGKTKVKTSKPLAQVKKSLGKKKNSATFQKKNRPALPKKDGDSLRAAITKSINEANENSAKEKACVDGKNFRVILPPVNISATKTKGKSK